MTERVEEPAAAGPARLSDCADVDAVPEPEPAGSSENDADELNELDLRSIGLSLAVLAVLPMVEVGGRESEAVEPGAGQLEVFRD
jgi:hypothetical protein